MQNLFQNLRLNFIMLFLFGGVYPFAIIGIGQLAMPNKADGSPITLNGRIIGFENVGQGFEQSEYFWPRPSAVDYNAASTGGSNKGPTNPDHLKEVATRVKTIQAAHPDQIAKPVPADLVTASGSGIDPDISVEAALYQAGRVARANHISKDQVQKLIENHTTRPWLGLFGPEHVNVLRLNLQIQTLHHGLPN